MKATIKLLFLWAIGGAIYFTIESIWRGYSHISMFILGGLCFVLLGGINNWFPWELGLVWQSLIGSATVTVAELLTGIIVNCWLQLNVWDYSSLPFNFLGQICLYFTLAWIPLSTFAIVLDDFCRWALWNEEKPHYTFL